jgi:TonB family protein
MRFRTAILRTHVLAATLVAAVFAQQAASGPATRNQSATPATASVPAIPSYPNTARGLEKLMKDMLKLSKNGDKQALVTYARSLVLPDAENWFKSVFGDALGVQLAAASERSRIEVEMSAPDTLAQFDREKRINIEAVRFDDSCDAHAMPIEYPFLLLRQRAEPLYDVRFRGDGEASVWLYFAYGDGAFRYVGSLRKKGLNTGGGRAKSTSSDASKILQVGGTVQMAQLIRQDMPIYPVEAKRAGIQGNVIFHAIIGKDGSIQDLELIEGQCALSAAASDAVQKWRYKPTLLQGEPVAVDTTITVVFTLGH